MSNSNKSPEAVGSDGNSWLSSEVPSFTPVPGQTVLGKYEIERVLGVGGMGIVVAARHLQLGQRVAIKFVRSGATSDPNAAARFLREARAAAALSSEHVAKVLDVGTLDDGAPFIVIEYLAGVDLHAVLENGGPMGIPEAVGTVLQACEAIAEAHSLGIVHRDLKPSNLFVARRADGSKLIKVLDFGISKSSEVTPDQSLTASGSLMGSPAYMSPEQVRTPKSVDARADVWALGVILFELLTGKPPFLGDTLGETFARIITEPAAPIRSIRADVPEGLAAVIARCLERDVTRRIPNVAALASGLLPFAPRDAEISVSRILRIAGVTPSGSSTATFSTGDGPSSGGQERFGTPEPRVPTASVWQTSGSRVTPAPRVSKRAVILVTASSVGVIAAALAVRVLRGQPDVAAHADTRASAAVSPPTATTSVAEPPAAPDDPTAADAATGTGQAQIAPMIDSRSFHPEPVLPRAPPSDRTSHAPASAPTVKKTHTPPTPPTNNDKDIF